VKEESYFFRLSRYGERLLDFYRDHPDFVQPAGRFNEVKSFVAAGLEDLSVSRTTFKWGIPVPGDERHVLWVWMDALSNYYTALRRPEDLSAELWPSAVHLVGKDILRFHAIYWPAFLMAAGIAPPRRIFAHGWWTNEGQKISKSLGNVIDPVALVAEFGLDPIRYFLLREVPFGQDGDFSRSALIGRNNGELANALGNLANRTLSLIQRNCGGTLPGGSAGTDDELAGAVAALPGVVAAHLDRQEFHLALEAIFSLVRDANGYITEKQPWALKKTDEKRMDAVLRQLHVLLRTVGTVLQPFMPGSMARLLDQLGVPEAARGLADLATPLPAGLPLPPPSPLFARIETP
jgi:methionyl-tRNA synthetase